MTPRWLILGLGLLMLWAAAPLRATTTCSVTSVTALNFGTVDPTGGNVDSMATVNYSCTYSGGLLGGLNGVFVRMCLSLGSGNASTSLDPRRLSSGSNTMNYQIYKDSNRSQVLGNLPAGIATTLPLTMNFTILSNGQTQNASTLIYGRVPAGQTSLATSPGYSSVFSGNSIDTVLTYAYTEALLSIGSVPATCLSGNTANSSPLPSFTVSASVGASCTLGTATDLDFGTVPGQLGSAIDKTSLLRLTCTNGAAWQLGLDNGGNASGSQRRMSNGSRFINYELYRDSSRSQRWGETLNSDTVSGFGSGSEQSQTVYGRVPAQLGVPEGSYTDTIKVTITY